MSESLPIFFQSWPLTEQTTNITSVNTDSHYKTPVNLITSVMFVSSATWVLCLREQNPWTFHKDCLRFFYDAFMASQRIYQWIFGHHSELEYWIAQIKSQDLYLWLKYILPVLLVSIVREAVKSSYLIECFWG